MGLCMQGLPLEDAHATASGSVQVEVPVPAPSGRRDTDKSLTEAPQPQLMQKDAETDHTPAPITTTGVTVQLEPPAWANFAGTVCNLLPMLS